MRKLYPKRRIRFRLESSRSSRLPGGVVPADLVAHGPCPRADPRQLADADERRLDRFTEGSGASGHARDETDEQAIAGGGGIGRGRGREDTWRATPDSDDHYEFAMVLNGFVAQIP